eukprot:scaffold8439_cov51-Phaeocystis_antarctica.AAC.1
MFEPQRQTLAGRLYNPRLPTLELGLWSAPPRGSCQVHRRSGRPRRPRPPPRPRAAAAGSAASAAACMLEHSRQWLNAQWAGLSPGSAEPVRAARRSLRRHRSRPTPGPCQGGRVDHAAGQLGDLAIGAVALLGQRRTQPPPPRVRTLELLP